MNELIARYSSRGLVVLGFPCNQFAFQENMGNGDILNILKYVRPGNNYVPTFNLMERIDVNGDSADPLFKWLRGALPLNSDIPPYGAFIASQQLMLWQPASRTDLDWNFSKFLVGRNGLPIKRWSPATASTGAGVTSDIERALDNRTREIEVLPEYRYALDHTIVRPLLEKEL